MVRLSRRRPPLSQQLPAFGDRQAAPDAFTFPVVDRELQTRRLYRTRGAYLLGSRRVADPQRGRLGDEQVALSFARRVAHPWFEDDPRLELRHHGKYRA